MRALVLLLPIFVINPLVLAQRLSAADSLHALAAQGHLSASPKPWHMRVSLTFAGENKTTVEEWFVSDSRHKVVIHNDTFNQTIYRSDTETFINGDNGAPPFPLHLLLEKIVHPAPEDEEMADVQLQRSSLKPCKTTFDCIILAEPVPRLGEAPIGLFPTYFLDPDTKHLRAAYMLDGAFLSINQTGTFLNMHVPMQIDLKAADKASAAAATVEVLETLSAIEAGIFTPPIQARKVDLGRLTLPEHVMEKNIVKKVAPAYPPSARQSRITGSVIFKAIIGRDGHILRLRVVQSPSADLAVAAYLAVRQWVYQPYLVDGEPKEVEYPLTVHFSMS